MTYHVPVMAKEVIDGLKIEKGKTYLDCTLGGGGHSGLILNEGGKVVAIDRDDDAIEYCKTRLVGDVTYIKGKYEDAKQLLGSNGIETVAGAVMDLGVSSHQLDDASRGFSYSKNGPLDMRMDKSQDFSAYDVINGYSKDELCDVIRRYGEESFAARIASAIVKSREKSPIDSTERLSEIIVSSVPYRKSGHPAKKTFQAVRIEVNGELKGLYRAITDVFGMIQSGGRLAVISFHSLEDRIVKAAYREFETDCICPKSLPVCVCDHRAIGRGATRIRPSEKELEQNPRSQSATLRIIEKL